MRCKLKSLLLDNTDVSQVIYEQTGGNQDFALIRSKGGQALFNKSTQSMKARWKVPDNRPLADFAPFNYFEGQRLCRRNYNFQCKRT